MDYTLSIGNFEAVDNEACIREITAQSSAIGEAMIIKDGQIVFDPDETFNRWRSEEETIPHVIAQHIKTGSVCRMVWESDVLGFGGWLICRKWIRDIVQVEMVAMHAGIQLPIDAAIAVLGIGALPAKTWDFRNEGEHPDFPLSDWRYEVGNGDTTLGYQQWVESSLDFLEQQVEEK